jgi:hypothetical protein
VALVLGFTMHLGGAGFWMGMIAGGATQVTLLSVITAMTNWEKMVGSLILFFYLMLLLHKDLIAIDDAFLPVFFLRNAFLPVLICHPWVMKRNIWCDKG